MGDLPRAALALSDPLRLQILDLLAAGRAQACCSPWNPEVPGGVCACDILPVLGDMGQSRLAYHMKVLREAGLVTDQKHGRWIYYTLSEDGFRAFVDELQRRYLTATDPDLVTPVRSAAGGVSRSPDGRAPEGGACC